MNLKDYIQGKRHGKEANELERKAMNDAFLQDALDGFDAVQGEHLPVIEELEKRISTPKTQRNITPVWRWAVAVIAFLLIGTSLFEIFNLVNKNQPQTAVIIKPQKNNIEVKKTDSTAIANNIKLQTTSEHNIKKYHFPTIGGKNMKTDQSANESVNGYVAKNMLEEGSNEKSLDRFGSLNKPTSSPSFAPVNMNDNTPLKQKIAGLEVNSPNQYAWLRDSIKTNWESTLQGQIAGLSIHDSNSYGRENNTDDNMLVRGVSSIKSLPPIKQAKGRLLDENGEPLAGASVVLKGTKRGVLTNFDGEFTLPLVDFTHDSLLVATYIGYNKQEIPIKANVGDVKLLADNKALNEVVVVGYGVAKRNTVTASTSPIKDGKYTFGENEFIDFFEKNYNKNICVDKKGSIKATVEFNEQGHPINITNVVTNCPELENELRKWLEKSPNWTIKNRKVKIKLNLKL